MTTVLTAAQFVKALKAYPPSYDPGERMALLGVEGDKFLGVRMGQIFELAKTYIEMPPGEIEKLLESAFYEIRSGGMSIMGKQASRKKTPASRRKELFDLYLRRHDRINSWGLVDLAAPQVVGGYLFDKPRDILYKLARSKNTWERRTAIVSTAYFIGQGDTADTFKIAEILVNDPEDLVQKAVGGWVREAGKKDRAGLLAFLDKHAASMPRTMLRYAVEKLDETPRAHYMGIKKAGQAVTKTKRA